MIGDQASWVFRGTPFVAFACYLTVSAIVPIITDAPLPLAFLADLIGGAALPLATTTSVAIAGARAPTGRNLSELRTATHRPRPDLRRRRLCRLRPLFCCGISDGTPQWGL